MYGKGTVSINAENIMPVIKQWLYSDKEIFVREVISNACDAIHKHSTLVSRGETEASEEPYRVDVIVNKKEKTLEFRDNGIGMTAEELEKYISQVAFSGASEFIERYVSESGNDQANIIGHFGLGFYSVFMVSDKVEIDTRSYNGEPAARWVSEDGMEYEIEPSDREARGTAIRLTISNDCAEFLDSWKLREVLQKHCGYLSTPIYLTEIKEENEDKAKEGEDKKEPEQINDTDPLWMRRPADCKDEDYREFYRKCFHVYDEPLFWIHLNAEYPFNLKGVLYFPKINNEFSASEGIVKLYNNQVFVADNIKEVIPEFLLLLRGVIDCPDLPLNVSRSFLQNDGYVRKMAAYITRKVADRLLDEFNNHREDYQRYWDDIHPFIKYGCIKDAKFYERVKPALIYKTTKGDYLTGEEYRARNCDTDQLVIYYTSDEKRQAQMIRQYTEQGKDVVILNTLIDTSFISFLESNDKDAKLEFRRIDATSDDITNDEAVSEESRAKLEGLMRKAMNDDKLEVSLKHFKNAEMISMFTVDEQSRRFADMSARWGNGSFSYPEKKTLVLNAAHPVVQWLENAGENDKVDAVCHQVYDLAEMARTPLVADQMVAFLQRSAEFLTQAVEQA